MNSVYPVVLASEASKNCGLVNITLYSSFYYLISTSYVVHKPWSKTVCILILKPSGIQWTVLFHCVAVSGLVIFSGSSCRLLVFYLLLFITVPKTMS